jgi:hypothetical protein
MQLIKDEIRGIAKDILTRARRELSKKSGSECYISTIDSFCKVLQEKRNKNPKAIWKDFAPELSAAYLSVFSTGLMGLGLNVKGRTIPLLPADWLNTKKKPDPNYLLALMFTLISNHCLSIITLVEKGLDMAARPLMRSTLELLLLICVISADREKMLSYSKAHEREYSRMIWYQHFSPKHLNKAFTEIEKRLNEREILPDEFEIFRRDTYDFYTETAHPTSLVSTLGSYADPPHEPGMAHYALLGTPSIGGANLLSDLALNVAYALHIFTKIITKIHRRPFPIHNSLFSAGAALAIALGNTLNVINKRADERDRSR